MYKKFIFVLFFFGSLNLFAQKDKPGYWQQHVDYTMDVNMNVDNYHYSGSQKLVYTNNSPDTLHHVFYHLYYNAFQPGSEMDVHSRNLPDPDPRVEDRINKLDEDEIGYLKLENSKQDGQPIEGKTVGTIYQMKLDKPLLPGEKTTLTLDFKGQVPVQIRRAGRNNEEDIALSMSQWYPKLAEYDYEGWHADPYIAREFHGVWGDFDVKITIDSDYTVGGSGYLQDPNKIGHGYQDNPDKNVKHNKDKLTWHFIAPKVHDFMWAADPDYKHDRLKTDDGETTLHFLYKDKERVEKDWKKFEKDAKKLYDYYTSHIGPYPYDQYSFIQGGDGGMEYAMSTLILGDKEDYGSLLGTAAHEFAHSWFQFVLATNESEHPWFDEGFTTYISTRFMNEVYQDEPKDHPFIDSNKHYAKLAKSGQEDPQTTHADRYKTNTNYSISSYTKGAIFLNQLGYVIGKDNLGKTLKRYYNEWQFKHPTPNDFIRVAEKVSGAELRWYLNDWTRTTNTIDYAIQDVEKNSDGTKVTLKRRGQMPMPLDITVTYSDDSTEDYYIPLQMMYWNKPDAGKVQDDWAWAYPTYDFTIDRPKSEISKIEIDPSQRMADVNRVNNVYEQ